MLTYKKINSISSSKSGQLHITTELKKIYGYFRSFSKFPQKRMVSQKAKIFRNFLVRIQLQ